MVSIVLALLVIMVVSTGLFFAVMTPVTKEIVHMETMVERLAKDANLGKKAEQLFPEIFGESLEDLLKEEEV
jgi:hypothetical protein